MEPSVYLFFHLCESQEFLDLQSEDTLNLFKGVFGFSVKGREGDSGERLMIESSSLVVRYQYFGLEFRAECRNKALIFDDVGMILNNLQFFSRIAFPAFKLKTAVRLKIGNTE